MIRKKLPRAFGKFNATSMIFDNHTIILYPIGGDYMFYASIRHALDKPVKKEVLSNLRKTVEQLKKLPK